MFEVKMFNLDRDWEHNREIYRTYHDRVGQSGLLINGPMCRDFEELFSNFFTTKINDMDVRIVQSGTHALEIATDIAINHHSGDNIQHFHVPWMTHPATIERLGYLGKKMTFYPPTDTGIMNFDSTTSVFRRGDEKYKHDGLLIYSQMFGSLPNGKDLIGFRKETNIKTTIVDAAQNLGMSLYDNDAQFHCFSLDPTKNLHGMNLAGILVYKRTFRTMVDGHLKHGKGITVNIGGNGAVSEMTAAVLVAKMRHRIWEREMLRRHEIGETYLHEMDFKSGEISIVNQLHEQERTPKNIWQKFVIMPKTKFRAETLQDSLRKYSINFKTSYENLSELNKYNRVHNLVEYSIPDHSADPDRWSRILQLPIDPYMHPGEIEQVIKAVNEGLK